MTAARWLSERKPAPPPELSAAIAGALSDSRHDGDVKTQLASAIGNLLPRVVAAECSERSGALDLLTLDALITYSMEASSGSAAECEAMASSLLSMIGSAARGK